jgi:hypothetical protein
MTKDGLNWLNAGLMIVACFAALVAPFHLFLFSYAVLGPLHYLTEISWLHDRDYFAPKPKPRKWWLVLVAATMIVLMYGFISSELLHRPVPPKYEIGMVYLVFATALIVLYVRHVVNAAALIVLALGSVLLFSATRTYALLAYFLITIIHVLFFTAAFVLYGALRNRSVSGFISLAVFSLCSTVFFVWVPHSLPPSAAVQRTYDFFAPLNTQLIALTGRSAVAIMGLVAFAYTYHYLNWFSKTSIIRWHEISRARGISIVVLWALAVGIYLYDFNIGLAVLYLLSALHVLLEFPLDHQTFVGIGRELRALFRIGIDRPLYS